MNILVMIIALVGVVFNVRKRWEGFLFWILTNAYWCRRNISLGEYEQAALYAVFFCLSIYGAFKWRRLKPVEELTEGDKWYVSGQFQKLSYQGSIKDFETIGKLKARLRAADITIEFMGGKLKKQAAVLVIAERLARRIIAIKKIKPWGSEKINWLILGAERILDELNGKEKKEKTKG